MKHVTHIILIAFCAACTSDEEPTVRSLGDGRYELILRSNEVFDVSEAETRLASPAADVCGSLDAQFETYDYESQEPLDGNAGNSMFTFRQIIRCANNVKPVGKAIPRPSYEQPFPDSELKERITSDTISYLRHKAEGDPNKAVDALSEYLRETSGLLAKSEEYRRELGTIVSLDVPRVTIYRDPPGAPKPGLYVAADYHNRYSNVPVQCGYLMWYQVGPAEFEITREETGIIEPDTFRGLDEQELSQALQHISCVSR